MAKASSKIPLDEQRFQLLINSVTDYAIYMLDLEGHVISWNSGAKRFKGYEAEEIIGQHYSRFFTEEDRLGGLAQRALQTAAQQGRFEAEGWRIRKDGSRFWANAIIDPIRDGTGQLIGYAKITRDITEKKAAEQRLFESEQRFRMLVQGVRDYALYMLDPGGLITNWNNGAEAIKGYSAAEIVGQHFSRFYTLEDRESGLPARALATALREGRYEAEGWRLRKDGSRFCAHVVIDPIRADTGEHIGFAKITRDITENRRAQRELEDARAALFQSQKLQALGELTGGIAHDFNNLMTVIRGSADLLRRPDLGPEKTERYLSAIIETADRAATLTSHLLAFGRRQPLKPEVIDLNIRLDALAEVLTRTLGGRVEVKLDLAPSLWLVEADSTQLETALLNAAINARDAMPDGGELTIATRNVPGEQGDLICIALHDTGHGMPAEIAERAFEPFFTTKPVGKGTGLGLSQIHGFAAQSGGKAEIDSKAGRGTTIRIYLPRSSKAETKSAKQQDLTICGNGKTVLVVEDNDHVREFAQNLLADLQYEVIGAGSAEEALELLDRRPVDAVFSDIVMPGLGGLELARNLHERMPHLPVLLATGYSEEVTSGAADAFQMIHKPYGADSLGAALANVIKRGELGSGP
ncbi:hybrid sensor histidine kinase/response regulator [Sphingosinicella rhizophila]|uniref:histidine kinase n=1 Tax=Sphingosinicella rhizophila TaxID=3050082 RepID=A0ABU3QAN2_9SPHN|nr:PAS domain S-box protein [Sphingosinicella sp. GR2756]MDT9600457.1 PAS domain S-box protein [Sphingosinicella sp. GR2756]